MKNILFSSIILLSLLISCKKDEIKYKQTITYEVDCARCLVTFNTQKSVEKLVIENYWLYKFENINNLDSVNLKIEVSAIGLKQQVKSSITTNDRKKVEFNGFLGFNEDYTQKSIYDTTLVLKL